MLYRNKLIDKTLLVYIIAILIGIKNHAIIAQDLNLDNNTGQYFDNKATEDQKIDEQNEQDEELEKTINKIIIIGNIFLPEETILSKIPYREGQIFDSILTGQLIRNLYELGYFDNVEIRVEDVSDDKVNLIIELKGKKKLQEIEYIGNYYLTKDEIEKKYKFSEIATINEEEAKLLAQLIKKLYQEKNLHDAKVEFEILPISENNVKLIFKIEEGKKALVKQVNFVGNISFPAKKLRSMIFTREDWILGALDKSGTYQPEALEYDKHVIENFYQSRGFLAAKVSDIKVDIQPITQNISITYFIEEGDLYVIKSLKAPGNELLSEEAILASLPIGPNQLYSKELIRQCMELLRSMWGQFGYIYADIEPIVLPDFDTKTVDITFNSDLGKRVFLNRINIYGNFKTLDKVIRRTIISEDLSEGQLITTQAMDFAKSKVESLGFFDPRDGVTWKINKISEDAVDLELYLKEIKTGRFQGQIGFDGFDMQSPARHIKVTGGVLDRNFMGTGIRYNLNLSYAREDMGVFFSIFNPWIFDLPIGAGFDAYSRKSTYEDFKNVNNPPTENLTGVTGVINFIPSRYPTLATIFNIGFENIQFQNQIKATSVGSTNEDRAFQEIVNKRFESGKFVWLGFMSGQDLRNHPVFPSRGFNWNLSSKLGIPTNNDVNTGFGFFKVDLDATWLTPIINDHDLIFLLHGHMGLVRSIRNRNIPYRELYHIGGAATIRGFDFGQIGPQLFGDSLGAQNAFWLNAELIFAITPDNSIRALLFYDGGAGWDTPNAGKIVDLGLADRLRNNNFNFRHSIGFGIRLTNPSPIRIDWGFKLDRNKKLGESVSEVHFGMQQEF